MRTRAVGRRLRWVLAAALAAGILTIPAAAAQAHPLGNFTVNTSAGLVVGPDLIRLEYVVDMAEIPAFQERQRIDADGDGDVSAPESAAYRDAECASLAGGLSIVLDGGRAAPARGETALVFPMGQAGLRTLRLTCTYGIALPDATSHRLQLADTNFADRIGWREVIAAGDGATLTRADVPTESPSGGLRAYPTGAAPMHVTTATLMFRPGGPALAADPTGRTSPTGGTVLEDLLARGDLGLPAILMMFCLAVAVGALHALGPGHGKALIGASLSGSEATLRHAVTVGVAVSVMHTASVLALGLVVATAERVISPERVYPWLGLVAGLAAVGLGARLLVTRLRALSAERRHGHRHVVPVRPLSRAGLIALAFSGGILPSPSALVVLLGAISIGRASLGLLLIAAFSLGLAASLVLVGAIAVRIGRLGRSRVPTGIVRWAPVASAASIAMLGLVVAGRGLAGT